MKKIISIIATLIIFALAVLGIFLHSSNQKKQFDLILDTDISEIKQSDYNKFFSESSPEKKGYKPYSIKLNIKNSSKYSILNVSLNYSNKDNNIAPRNYSDLFAPYSIFSEDESIILLCIFVKDGLSQNEIDKSLSELSSKITLQLVKSSKIEPTNYDKTINVSAKIGSSDSNEDVVYPDII